MEIFSIVNNVLFYLIMSFNLFTDVMTLPSGQKSTFHRNAIHRLYVADKMHLFYFEAIFVIVSIATSFMIMSGTKSTVIKVIQFLATVFSSALFILIMITAYRTNPKY